MNSTTDNLESIQEDEIQLRFAERQLQIDMRPFEKRQLQIDRQKEELKKRRKRLGLNKITHTHSTSQRPTEAADQSRESTTLTVIPFFPQETVGRVSSERRSIIEIPSATATPSLDGLPASRALQDDNPNDELRPVVHSDEPELIDDSVRIPPSSSVRGVRGKASHDRNGNATPRNPEHAVLSKHLSGTYASTRVAKTKVKRTSRLYRVHTFGDHNYDPYTTQSWWEQVAEPFLDNHTSLIEMIIKCKAQHPASKWSPLEFLQRTTFTSILRQAGLADYKPSRDPKITTAGIEVAADNPKLYNTREKWSGHPDFQRALRERECSKR